jgi:hypothetical protein
MPGQTKGKCKHSARKNKYAKNPIKSIKNKQKRYNKHVKRLTKILEKSCKTTELLNKVLSSLNITKIALNKMIGTLNHRRLQQVLDGTFRNSQWYISRCIAKERRKHACYTTNKIKREDTAKQNGKEE